MSDRPIEELTFEEAMRALEQVVERIESSDLSLEETLALFERGMRLAQRCETLLDQAELRVTELTELIKGGAESFRNQKPS